MIDPKRIPRLLEKIENYWTKNPDLRLGQILDNFATESTIPVFYYEDDLLESKLDKELVENMITIGMHYKVTWHWKANTEVASSNMNTYIEVPGNMCHSEMLVLIKEEVERDVERNYPDNKHNTRVELKKVVYSDTEAPEYHWISYTGDQTEINKELGIK